MLMKKLGNILRYKEKLLIKNSYTGIVWARYFRHYLILFWKKKHFCKPKKINRNTKQGKHQSRKLNIDNYIKTKCKEISNEKLPQSI